MPVNFRKTGTLQAIFQTIGLLLIIFGGVGVVAYLATFSRPMILGSGTAILVGLTCCLSANAMFEEHEFSAQKKQLIFRRKVWGKPTETVLADFQQIRRVADVKVSLSSGRHGNGPPYRELRVWVDSRPHITLLSTVALDVSSMGLRSEAAKLAKLLDRELEVIDTLPALKPGLLGGRVFDPSDNPSECPDLSTLGNGRKTHALGKEPVFENFRRGLFKFTGLLLMVGPIAGLGSLYKFSVCVPLLFMLFTLLVICGILQVFRRDSFTSSVVIDLERQQVIVHKEMGLLRQQKVWANLEDVAFVAVGGEIPPFPLNAWWDHVVYIVTKSGRKLRVASYGVDFPLASENAQTLARSYSWVCKIPTAEQRMRVVKSRSDLDLRFAPLSMSKINLAIMLGWTYATIGNGFTFMMMFAVRP